MHVGWPSLEETIAILFHYPQVYTDLGAIDWLLPRAEFHGYLGALTRAGFGKRIMFGSDQMFWPEAIGMAVEAVDSAKFLTASEKRDIFYGNAVRFFRLGEGQQTKRRGWRGVAPSGAASASGCDPPGGCRATSGSRDGLVRSRSASPRRSAPCHREASPSP